MPDIIIYLWKNRRNVGKRKGLAVCFRALVGMLDLSQSLKTGGLILFLMKIASAQQKKNVSRDRMKGYLSEEV